MQLGAISTVFVDQSLAHAAGRLRELALKFIEIGAGGFFPKHHCDPSRLLADPGAMEELQTTVAENGLVISALAMHGEPLHPDPAIAERYAQEFQAACKLAERLQVTRITLLAGLPEPAPGEKTPNWILFPFPPRNLEMLKYQWDQRVIPYWKEQTKIARDHGVRLCFEMVPADVVHNPETLLRLRDAVGPTAGCNFDPSHLFWQGIDPLEAVRFLGPAIYHVHAKDSRVDEHIARVQGVLDPKPFQDLAHRSWLFRTVGFGHGESFWRNLISVLRLVGYDDVLSIEHEDPLIDPEEGLALAVALLRQIMVTKPRAKVWFD